MKNPPAVACGAGGDVGRFATLCLAAMMLSGAAGAQVDEGGARRTEQGQLQGPAERQALPVERVAPVAPEVVRTPAAAQAEGPAPSRPQLQAGGGLPESPPTTAAAAQTQVREAPALIRAGEAPADAGSPRAQRVEQLLAPPPPPAPLGFDDLMPVTPPVEAPAYNPYGFRAAWEDGDLLSKALIVVLFLMSGLTWYILFTKLIEQHRISEQKKHEVPRFWSSPSLDEGLAILQPGTPYWYVVDRGLDAAQNYHGTLGERIELNEWVSMSIGRAVEEIIAQSQKGLAVLATVGSTAPFVGLLGTVWGIFHALTAIGVSGQASIDVVAGPVGEALIMTALGLAVAVPAVMSYNWLLRRNKARIDAIRGFASDLHTVLLSGGRVETLSHRGY